MSTTEMKLQAIIDSKEAIRIAINNKGVNVGVELPFNQYASKINEIGEGRTPKWQSHPDWWNIEQIFKDDPDPNKRFILLVTDSNNTIALNQSSLGNSSTYYKTSDGQTYNATSNTHTWDILQDKWCSLGYKTRYVIVYSSNTTVTCNISALNVNYAYFGNSSIVASFIAGSSTPANANAILESIQIENSVTALSTSIGNDAFRCCTSLAAITIPYGVTSIGNSAFYSCYSLISATISNSVTSLGDGAFRECFSLTSIIIPNSVTSIGECVLQGCASLRSITIPDGITSIKNSAFYYCYSLTSIIISNSVTSIGANAFRECFSLTSLVIPNSVTSIGNGAFQGCQSLISLTIPNSLTSIGTNAFQNLYGLLSININNGWIAPAFNVSISTRLSVSSMLDMFNKLGTAPTTRTITLGSTNLNKLTITERAIATSKGYILA